MLTDTRIPLEKTFESIYYLKTTFIETKLTEHIANYIKQNTYKKCYPKFSKKKNREKKMWEDNIDVLYGFEANDGE